MKKFKVLTYIELTASIEVEAEDAEDAQDIVGDLTQEELLQKSNIEDWKNFEILKTTKVK